MSVFCYFYRWVGFVDAMLCNSAWESPSHLLQTREITEVIGPKWGGVPQRSLQTAATGLQLTGQLNKKLGGALEKWGPDLFWNATINCNRVVPNAWVIKCAPKLPWFVGAPCWFYLPLLTFSFLHYAWCCGARKCCKQMAWGIGVNTACHKGEKTNSSAPPPSASFHWQTTQPLCTLAVA